MILRNKIYFIIIAASYFIAVLFVLVIAANAEEAGAHAVEQEIVTGPGQHDLSLISSQPWLVEGEVLGTLTGSGSVWERSLTLFEMTHGRTFTKT